ncbi:Nuclear cap-binding protein subunit 1 [Microbotryomycetes sp. JL201]|nr:Nuclear cap-binding protein subunit 1 [Microbotryomycetes sp. JL201]
MSRTQSYYGGGGYRNGGGGGGGYGTPYNRGYDQAHSGTYYSGGNRKRGRDDDPMDGPAYRRRANERGDFNSPGRPRGGNSRDHALHAFRESVWKVGADQDYDPETFLPSLASTVRSQFNRDPAVVYSTMRAAVVELPHKLPHLVALIAQLATETPSSSAPSLLSRVDMPIKPLPNRLATKTESADAHGEKPDDVEMNSSEKAERKPNVGREIVQDLVTAFQQYLDERKWRSVRFSVFFFAHLTSAPKSAPLVTLSSLLALLSSFAAVLDEPGLRAARGDECVRIVAETILRLGNVEGTDALKDSLQSYISARKIDKELFAAPGCQEQYEDPVEHLVNSIGSADASDLFPDIQAVLLGNNDSVPSDTFEPVELPQILVPPEMDEADAYRVVPPEVTSAGLRGDEGVGYGGVRLGVRLFDGDSVPASNDARGVLIRSLVFDVMDIYETNRKEAAAVLLDLPSWIAPGTFKSLKGDDETEGTSQLVLEDIVVEAIFDSILSLPTQSLLPAYYHALLTELCRLSPSTVAPALGKCVRRVYKCLGEKSGSPGFPSLDAEGMRRFAEWFSVHLSNFGFQWPWKDWAPDMDSLESKHPKRAFVKRVIELEVRLSYFDRVRGTLPEELLDTGVIAEDAPGPNYQFGAEDHPHKASAQSLLRMIQQKATIGEVNAELNSFEDTLVNDHSLERPEAASVKLDMAVQSILQVGSRSFSHFLNALERYLQLLRNLTSAADKRVELLTSVAKFWSLNRQFHLIVLEKLLQYRLVDSVDVVSWCFSQTTESWSDFDLFAALASTVRQVQNKISMSKLRLDGVRREDETRRAGAEHEIDLDKAMVETDRADDSAEVQQAQEGLTQAEQELAQIVGQALTEFDRLSSTVTVDGEDEEGWVKWWIEGWTRQFCRQILGPKGLNRGPVLEAVAALDIAPESTVGAIIRSAKMWSDFA